ncbi:MAG: hypothetical protein VZQ80_03835 [Lachnospiraceae bacterium]|nr:hypothetical protein [Lachnospiraceae bacterium]
MAVMDEFKEEREAVKHGPIKKRIAWFFDYNKWKILAIVLAAVCVGTFIYQQVTKRNTVLYVAMVNFAADPAAEEDVQGRFESTYLENPKKERIVLDSDINIALNVEGVRDGLKYRPEDEEKLGALSVSGGLDLMITGEDVFRKYATQGYFVPLTDVYGEDLSDLPGGLSKEELLTIDGEAAAIPVDSAELLKKYYYYTGAEGQKLYLGFVYGGAHPEYAKEFADFLFQ